MDGRVKPGHDENASGSIVEFRDRCPVTGFKHASLRRRGRFLIRLYAGELAIERRSAIDIGTFVPRRKHACAPATSVENKNTENAGRDTLDDQHRLKGAWFEQGEQEFSYGLHGCHDGHDHPFLPELILLTWRPKILKTGIKNFWVVLILSLL